MPKSYEQRWDTLSHEAAVRVLLVTGHATGLAAHDWFDLPHEIQTDIIKHWGRPERRTAALTMLARQARAAADSQ